ncbi:MULTISPECIES: hypothetical protein [unclassified Sphingomonas]|uniref:hypothetical protein n=1 Tax=Sphingomonas sp. PvP015 TaxID=3156388 RepID=UPI003395D86A
MYDLLAFVSRLEKRRKHAEFCTAVREASRYSGLEFDLQSAVKKIETLILLFTKREVISDIGLSDHFSTIVGGLYDSAILHYVRSTSGAGRPKPFKPAYNEKQRMKHEHLGELRSGAIAHRGPGNKSNTTHMYDTLLFSF